MNGSENPERRNKELLERVDLEINFAAKFIGLYPAMKTKWGRLVERARSGIQHASNDNRRDMLEKAVYEAEKIMAPIGVAAKKHIIHCVGHAHIDMNWMWSWPETVAVANDSFSTVLKLMEEYPDFVFSQSQASTYRIIEEHNPAMLEQIKQRVKEGRWELNGAAWVEQDLNVPSGESHVRQYVYGNRFFRREFGVHTRAVWLPDVFGYTFALPQIMKKAQIDFMICGSANV